MLIIGHRGASRAEAENTPAAFRTADRMGADGVELDVRLAIGSDGVARLVVHHDPLPASPTELDRLPGFDEVLEACGGRMLVNVEIKNTDADGGFDPSMAMVQPTLDAMRRSDPDPRRWLISSFSIETVDRCRELAPEFATAVLSHELDLERIAAAVAGGHSAVHPWEQMVTADGVEAAHDAGLAVNVWTCNDSARLVELVAMGVDGVCTDVPDVALEAIGRDGTPRSDLRWGGPAGDG